MTEQVTWNLGNCVIKRDATFAKQYIFTVTNESDGSQYLKCQGYIDLYDDICKIINDKLNHGEEINSKSFAVFRYGNRCSCGKYTYKKIDDGLPTWYDSTGWFYPWLTNCDVCCDELLDDGDTILGRHNGSTLAGQEAWR